MSAKNVAAAHLNLRHAKLRAHAADDASDGDVTSSGYGLVAEQRDERGDVLRFEYYPECAVVIAYVVRDLEERRASVSKTHNV